MTVPEHEIEQILEDIKRLAAKTDKSTGFCIGNTRKVSPTGLYFSPIRNTAKLVAGSAIVVDVKEARAITNQIDGKVDYILVDTEKKISPEHYGKKNIGNIERTVRETAKSSKVLTYKGNDLTVDSIDGLIAQLLYTYPRGLGGKKAVIIGAGNIGAKLALKLVERGMNMTITRRDQKKLETIVAALNVIKPAETVAAIAGTTDNLAAAKGADLLIGLTDGEPVITAGMIEALAPGAVLVDGGKGCFMDEALKLAMQKDIPIYRADTRPGFEGHIGFVLETERIISNSLGRTEIDGVPVVSGGLLGRKDEVVIDNINNPRFVFGLANGMGDFVRNPDAGQAELLRTIRNYIDEKGGK